MESVNNNSYNKKMLILSGISASGKTTYAKKFLANNYDYIRVSRDDVRDQLFNRTYNCLDEELVTSIVNKQIQAAFDYGYNVLVDNTSLRKNFISNLILIANLNDARANILKFEVDIDEAIKRDASREKSVGADVIRKQAKMYKDIKDFEPINYYFENLGRNLEGDSCLIVDIDGTLADRVSRDWWDFKLVETDELILHTKRLIDKYKDEKTIILLSGRNKSCFDLTCNWLDKWDVHFDMLLVREEDDFRADAIVKYELYKEYVYPFFNVEFVVDDRDQVVRMWRKIGLNCLQVNYGDF